MVASTIGCPGLIRILNFFFLMMIAAGCTSTGVIDPNQASIDPNSSVVAFSVKTAKLSEYETRIRPVRLQMLYGGESVSVRLSNDKTGVQRILIEVPAKAVVFSQFELVAGDGFFADRYRTGQGQPINLTQGEITYLGRIEIEDIEFYERADGSLGRPVAVKLVFADALEDDQIAWEQRYRLFQNREPNQQIVGNWTGLEYSDLWIKEKEWAKSRSIDGWTQEYTGGPRPPTERAPRSQRAPN